MVPIVALMSNSRVIELARRTVHSSVYDPEQFHRRHTVQYLTLYIGEVLHILLVLHGCEQIVLNA
jgi:hypothetical protein